MRWRLKSPASRLFPQYVIQAQNKENIKTLRHWPLCGEFPSQRASNAENVSISWHHHDIPLLNRAAIGHPLSIIHWKHLQYVPQFCFHRIVIFRELKIQCGEVIISHSQHIPHHLHKRGMFFSVLSLICVLLQPEQRCIEYPLILNHVKDVPD